MVPQEDGEMLCPHCEAVFGIWWNMNPEIQRIEFCPFCGEDMPFTYE